MDINELVRATHHLVEGMEQLKEDARRLYRFMKRTEVLVSDLRPYSTSNEALASSLVRIEAELSAVKRMLEDCAAKGKISAFMQADHMLASFTAACRRLDAALAVLPSSLPTATDAHDDVASLRASLQKAVFALPQDHGGALAAFREACDAVKGHAAALEEQCKDILQTVCGGRGLSRTEYAASVGDLQREIRTLRAYAVAAAVDSASAPPSGPPSKAASPLPGGAPGPGAAAAAAAAAAAQLPAPGAETRESAELSAYYLRVMLDVLRLANEAEEENVPLEFLCPLSTLIMHDPVVLFESGHSFERQALEDWWANGHRMCPKTGIPLKSKGLNVAPNVQLKEAIHRWTSRGDAALRFRPLLRLLSTASDSNNLLQPAFGLRGEESPASALAGRLEAALGPTPTRTPEPAAPAAANGSGAAPSPAPAPPGPAQLVAETQ
ncbi:hypothetical protein Rsub_10996 [Raphidocelis subcapitata]|uniref:U-box domain-containing protein n=1 Tax=Raphidocelis subcapitata TaxID=307507 RepID=A0A2V0PCU9_9CHLO|nr:hypothetical protein Rsub_10996 [Raphidocelis subcapitata]|eukprot:GBF97349.1 hypothetical protein Rsub_10996 [Raphidocelis subcapitata]